MTEPVPNSLWQETFWVLAEADRMAELQTDPEMVEADAVYNVVVDQHPGASEEDYQARHEAICVHSWATVRVCQRLLTTPATGIKNLRCSCCGEPFVGLQDPQHDTGYGTCPACVEWERERFFAPRIARLRECLSPKNLALFDSFDPELQRAFVGMAVVEGLMT